MQEFIDKGNGFSGAVK